MIEQLFELFLSSAAEQKSECESAAAFAERPNKSFFNCPGFFVEAVRAMPAATFAAITAFEVEFFGKAFVAFGRVIKIAGLKRLGLRSRHR